MTYWFSVKLLKSMLSMSTLSWTHCTRALYSSECLNAHEDRLPYLGHVVSKDGIKIDTKNMKLLLAGLSLPFLFEMQQFLGLTNFFCKYIQGYITLTMPLTVLLKNNTPFDWDTATCKNAFAGLKTAFTSVPCWASPDTSEGSPTFDLVCDASGFGLGAVPTQQGRPIAFWSRKQRLLSKIVMSLSKSCLLSLKHRKPSGAILMAYPLTWSLIINLTLSLTRNLHCQGATLAGVKTCSASTSPGITDQAGAM